MSQTPIRGSLYMHSRTIEVPPGGSATDFVRIDSDADFMCDRLAFYCFDSGSTGNSYDTPNLLVRLIDGASGRPLMSNPVPITSLFGTAKLPALLPVPHRIAASSQMQIEVTSREVLTMKVDLTLIGCKVGGAQ